MQEESEHERKQRAEVEDLIKELMKKATQDQLDLVWRFMNKMIYG